VVRKAKGKKRMKEEFTAAGLPVRSAIVYGDPVNASPQNAEDEAEQQHRHAERYDEGEVGDHQAEEQAVAVDRRDQQPIEVAGLDVGDERRGFEK
jgi:hypothetical protein